MSWEDLFASTFALGALLHFKKEIALSGENNEVTEGQADNSRLLRLNSS